MGLRVSTVIATLGLLAVAVGGCGGVLSVDETTSSTAPPAHQPDELAVFLQSCLAQAGYEAIVEPDGGITMRVPKDQHDAAVDARTACLTSFPEYDPDPPPPSAEELAAHFAALARSADCLENLGYDVPDPPTFDTWSANPGMWYPHDAVARAVEFDEWEALLRDCPQP
jgi:hypothetical protein